MKRGGLRGLIAILFALWLLLAFGSLYAIQKPFTAAQAAALAGTLWNLLAALWVFGMGTALGRRILLRAGLAMGTRLERVLFAAGIGLGTLSLVIFGLGLLGLLRPAILLPLFAAGVIYVAAELYLYHRRRPDWPLPLLSQLPRGLVVYIALIAGLTLWIALAPPLGWDSLLYHLTGPRLALETGRLVSGSDVPHFYYPGLAEMLYAWLLAVASEGAAAPLHLGYGVLAGAAVYALARAWFGPRAAWLSLAVWLSMPMVAVLAGWAYNDLALVFYQTLALAAVLRWRAGGDHRWLILGGIALGLEMGLKYTAAVSALALGLLVLWEWLRQARRRATWHGLRSLAAFIVPAALVAAPWYLKNWAFTGNPVYPFLCNSRLWDAFRAQWYGRPGTGIGWDPLQLLLLPWTAMVGIRDMNYYDGQMGPIFLVMLPIVVAYAVLPRVAGSRRGPAFGPILWVAGFLGAAWIAGVIVSRPLFQSRLLLPCLTALSPLLGFLIEDVERFSPAWLSWCRLLVWSVTVVLLLNGISCLLRVAALNPLPVLAGVESRQSYLERNLGQHAVAMEELGARVPADGKVLFLWEPRSYYADRPAHPDAILDNWPHLVYVYGDAEAIAEALRGGGYTHILLHRMGLEFVRDTRLDPLTAHDLEVWEALVRQYLRRVEWPAAPAYELYELLPAGGTG